MSVASFSIPQIIPYSAHAAPNEDIIQKCFLRLNSMRLQKQLHAAQKAFEPLDSTHLDRRTSQMSRQRRRNSDQERAATGRTRNSQHISHRHVKDRHLQLSQRIYRILIFVCTVALAQGLYPCAFGQEQCIMGNRPFSRRQNLGFCKKTNKINK